MSKKAAPKTEKKDPVLTVQVPENLDEKIETLAKAKLTSKSAIIREILARHLLQAA